MSTNSNDVSHEFLAFKLGPEEYGVDILSVQEIRGYDTVTRDYHARYLPVPFSGTWMLPLKA